MRIAVSLLVVLLALPGVCRGEAEDWGLGIGANGCPEGLVPLYCGRTLCQPPGSVCCNGIPCAPGQECLRCGDAPSCRAEGSTCCGEAACTPAQECRRCGTRQLCLPAGAICPGGVVE